MAASYCDVDGTLVRTSLIHPTLFYLTHQRTPFRSMLKLGRAVMRAPQMAWAEMQDRRLFNEALFSSFEGISNDRLLVLADDAFESVIRRRFTRTRRASSSAAATKGTTSSSSRARSTS